MLSNKLEDVTFEDVQALIDNEICEGKTIEYKSELHITNSEEKREFLADVSAFANADGGDLIFGIKEDEKTKLPDSIPGICIENEDETIRKIESMIRDSIQPRIVDIKFKMILVKNHKYILIMRIAASFIAPHRIIYRGWDKFFSRNSKGKYSMDVNELRTAFNMSQEIRKQIEDYKLNTIAEIVEDRYKIFKDGYPTFIIQTLPIVAFQRSQIYSIDKIYSTMIECNSNSFDIASNKQITVDGVILKDNFNNSNKTAYGYYKTNGIIQKSTTRFFNPDFETIGMGSIKKIKLIYRGDILKCTVKTLDEMFRFYRKIQISMPIIVSCAIVNGRGFTIPKSNGFYDLCGEIDRDVLLIPDILIKDLSISPGKCLQPIFDSIWNACGYIKCPNYDENGEFKENI